MVNLLIVFPVDVTKHRSSAAEQGQYNNMGVADRRQAGAAHYSFGIISPWLRVVASFPGL